MIELEAYETGQKYGRPKGGFLPSPPAVSYVRLPII